MSESSEASDAAGTANGSGALSHGGLTTAGQLVAAHLGSAGPGLELVQTTYPDWRWADVDAALDGFDEDQDLRGVVAEAGRSLDDLLADPSGAARLGPVRRTAVPISPDEDRWVAANALRLARVGGVPVVVLACSTRRGPSSAGVAQSGAARSAAYGSVASPGAGVLSGAVASSSAFSSAVDGGPHVLIQVLAADPAVARAVLADIDAAVTTDSFLRGRVLTVRTAPSASGPRTTVDIAERPGVVADDVVLAAGALDRLDAVVLDPSRAASRVLGRGQPLPRGVLLHGPPGAGASDAVRYLVSQSPDTTTFLLRGTSLACLRPGDSAALVGRVMTTAQQLAPALVVLEDADLVAADRRGHGGGAVTGAARTEGSAVPPALAELLDLLVEMDEDADVAVVLTTHRVETLAETLARRPDRLDLTLEVPLPDVGARARLFARAARALPVTSAGLRTAAEAAVATPSSFPARVVRRAVLDAVSTDGEVDDARLVATVHALMAEGAELRTATGAGAASRQNGPGEASNGEHPGEAEGGGSPVSATSAVPGQGSEGPEGPRQHDAAPWAEGSVAEVRGAGDVLAVIRAREARRDAFGAEGALGGTGPHADGLGGESGHDGLGGGGGADGGLDGGGGADDGRGGQDADVVDDLDDGLSGEDLLDLDLDDED